MTSLRLVRSFPLLLAGALLVGGCAIPGDATSPRGQSSMTEGASAKWMKQSMDAWNRHDANSLVALQGETGTLSAPGVALVGPAIGTYAQSIFNAQPDFKLKVIGVYPISDTLATAEWEASGTWTQAYTAGPLAGAKPTGKPYVLPGVSILETKDGKLVSHKQYYDRMGFLRQLGVIAP